MRHSWILIPTVSLLLTACASGPALTPSSSLADLAGILAADNGAGKRFVPSENGRVGLTLKHGWQRGWDAPAARFAQWCALRQGTLTNHEGSASKLDNELDTVLRAEKLKLDSSIRSRHCQIGSSELAILSYDPPNQVAMDLYYRHGASLFLVTGSELARHAPELVAAEGERNRLFNEKREAYAQNGRREREASQAKAKLDKETTVAALAGYKRGTRILCKADIDRRYAEPELFSCNDLPVRIDPEKLVLSGWNIVSKDRTASSIRIVLSKP